MVDVVEILRHWHAGRRIGQVCSSLAVDPKTVRKYTAKAIEAGLAPGGPPPSDIMDRGLRQSTRPEIEAHGTGSRAGSGWSPWSPSTSACVTTTA